MTRLREILRDRKGNGFPLAIAITLALVIIFCGISEYIRLLIIAQGVRDAVQTAELPSCWTIRQRIYSVSSPPPCESSV